MEKSSCILPASRYGRRDNKKEKDSLLLEESNEVLRYTRDDRMRDDEEKISLMCPPSLLGKDMFFALCTPKGTNNLDCCGGGASSCLLGTNWGLRDNFGFVHKL